MNKFKQLFQTKSFWWNLIILLIIIFVVLLRFVIFAQTKEVHYHANFRIYINGEALELSSDSYYEEIAACSIASIKQPSSRVHMHDGVSHLIHVHDSAVTYNHFFNNLGFHVSSEVLQIHDQVYINNNLGKLRFILNGKLIINMDNKPINNEDVLLIDFSNDDFEVLTMRYDQIPKDANQANLTQDPSGCFGSVEDSFSHQFKRALGF